MASTKYFNLILQLKVLNFCPVPSLPSGFKIWLDPHIPDFISAELSLVQLFPLQSHNYKTKKGSSHRQSKKRQDMIDIRLYHRAISENAQRASFNQLNLSEVVLNEHFKDNFKLSPAYYKVSKNISSLQMI